MVRQAIRIELRFKPVTFMMLAECLQECFVLKDDLLGRVDGGDVVDAADQHQVQRTRD